MSAEKKEDRGLVGMAFDEALARLMRVDAKEMEDSFEQARKEDEEAKRYAEERRESIRKGARRSPKRFRL